jgi:hypothetical protein
MPCIYHWRQPDFAGHTLYPQSRLHEVDPALAQAARARYAGRDHLLEERIPLLDVRWSEVVFCATIHPHHLYRALAALGDRPNPARGFFAIPAKRLRGLPAVIWSFRHDDLLPEDVAPFDPDAYTELTTLPAETAAHYAAALAAGRRPFLFQHLPHVLIAAPLDVRDVAVIPWSQPPAGQPLH